MSDAEPNAERVIRDWLLKAGCNEISMDFLLDHLEREWINKYKFSRNDGHFHSFDRHAQDFDYCQINGCQTTYVEYLGEL